MPIRTSTRFLLLTLVAVWMTVCPAPQSSSSQERPADNATASQIEEGVEKAKAGKLLDAVEHFQRVLDTAGDELVPVDRNHYLPARWVIHAHLSRLPLEGVKLYRQRVDGQAAKRLEEAKKSHDDGDLQRMLADMFAARATEDAIVELARRAFERGEFDAAERYWRLLLPPFEGDERLLRFPEPKSDAAAVKARLIMLNSFRGEREEAKGDLKLFREKHADAAGLLAGKKGKYVDTLMELLNDPAKTRLQPLPDQPGWPTFAGSTSRLGTLRTKLPYFWPDVETWRSPLPFLRGGRFDSPPPDASHPRTLAFHPVISNGRAYIADGTRVLSIDLTNGKIARAATFVGGEDARIPTRQDVRHTLTDHDGILYVRFGPTGLKAEGTSFIVALAPREKAKEEREPLWRLNPPVGTEGPVHFEGAPIIHRDRLYVGLWRQAGGEAAASVACYRIDDPKVAPELAWQRSVGKAGSEPNGDTRYRHALVTISGPNLVYCTDGGSVVALNAITGKPAWEYRYTRNERPTMPRSRDLCPPLADGGRIYAAPADTDRLLCLDAETGRLIWDREGVEVVHLLGVARNRLIATFAGAVNGIRGLNLRTGADSGESGWTIHDDGGASTFGRGLVTEEAIVWPTKHGLHFLNPADGSPLRSPIRGPFGNLCYADGVLLVTNATEVWGFLTEAKKLGERGQIDRPAFPLASGNEPVGRLDQVQVADGSIYARSGEEKLISYSSVFPSLRWTVAAHSLVQGVPFQITFDPHYCVGESHVIARVSTGHIAILESQTGQKLNLLKSTPKPWKDSPIHVGQSRFLWSEDGHLVQYDANVGKELARYSIPGPESLTGDLPRFRIHQGDPLVLINRNHGVEVDRLAIDGLKRAWKREPILVGRELDDVAFSGESFFTVSDGTLAARGWKDGEHRWDIPLPDSTNTKWKLTVSPQGLLVHPAEAIFLKPDYHAISGILRGGWDAARLLIALSKSYHVWSARELPILVIDPADGRLIQRLNFPAAGPAAGVTVTPKGVVVVTGKGSWTLNAKN